ncbi:hypothetical protein GCM10011391_21340 [Pullulanibacillus camelliae]|uniref:Uncharacterized protein n=1 Tax=Pullulanibacillus camelliae TaxID=1707096 RepID=A0A8J2YFH6_9BACL|nr:hypothetical protein GCM10011391_21340 [Pullulanibacillus camelliae]
MPRKKVMNDVIMLPKGLKCQTLIAFAGIKLPGLCASNPLSTKWSLSVVSSCWKQG